MKPKMKFKHVGEAEGVGSDATKTCSICKGQFTGFGHNPEPILPYEQRCCTLCNQEVVIPVRIFGMQNPTAMDALAKYGFSMKRRK